MEAAATNMVSFPEQTVISSGWSEKEALPLTLRVAAFEYTAEQVPVKI